jgi:geranylgeranyl diphosphate synthase type I
MKATVLVRPVRGTWEVLQDAGAEVFPALRQATDELPSELRHLVGMHFGWWDQDGAPPVDSPSIGKAVRPALVLLSCEAVGGLRGAGVPAAVAVELVHNATLLHDDIIDGDRLRRGRPAVWAACGVPAGILAGDALFFLAVQVLTDAPLPLRDAGLRELTGALRELVGGEYADLLLENRQEASVEECEAVAMAKTGSLAAASCALGALAGGANTQQIGHMRAFGSHVGMAFQLIDDLLGIWGDPTRTGKPIWSDLASRKKSLPVAAALASGGSAGMELAGIYAGTQPLSDLELERAALLVEEAGGRAWADREAGRHVEIALEHLRAACPTSAVEAELSSLARLISGRDR